MNRVGLCFAFLLGTLVGWLANLLLHTESPEKEVSETKHIEALVTSNIDLPENSLMEVEVDNVSLPKNSQRQDIPSTRSLLAENPEAMYMDANDFSRAILNSESDDDEKLVAIEHFVMQGASTNIAIGLGDRSNVVKLASIEGLAQVGNEESAIILGQVIMSAQSSEIKKEALMALARLSYHDVALIFIQHAATQDPNQEVRDFGASLL
ncbi:hypothetical protein HII17_18575 [Thalassotalea sp. M1531]|uniref:HEAT repeat domain-containing protein n=1 Tax=Thalassotalea algicola TaxID=2716224 RepID=A0A7Y0Q928_9GAMM|nr:HEAT repeat domain-containing protein [Thalassotalea algicola]NMP33557.1 hypothetical protein [Thalassotalea algicola]